MGTRTYTHYFAPDDPNVKKLADAIFALEDDWVRRSPHVEEHVRNAGDIRLELLKDALWLLTERAPDG